MRQDGAHEGFVCALRNAVDAYCVLPVRRWKAGYAKRYGKEALKPQDEDAVRRKQREDSIRQSGPSPKRQEAAAVAVRG